MKRDVVWLLPLLVACSSESKTKERLSREELMKPETCRDCHPKHYDEWSGSMHAYATDDPVFLAMNTRGQEETGGQLGKLCVNCHAPLAVREGYATDGRGVEEIPQHLKGITCYFCHNVKSVEGTHNNPLVLANDQTMRARVRDPADNPAHDSEYSALLDGDSLDSSKMCGACHDIVMPKELSGAAEDVKLERTYEEYLDTLYGRADRRALSCATCHMEADTQTDTIADYATIKSGRTRYLHTFPGVDIALTDFPQRSEQRAAVQSLLDVSVRAVLCVSITGGMKVTLDNVFVGHRYPSGASQDRRFWTEVISYDAAGKVLYSSGVVGEQDAVAELDDPDLWLMRDETFKRDDKPAHMFWDVARVVEQTLPGARTQSALEEGFQRELIPHIYRGSYGTGFPDRVTLRLRVRPIGLDVIRDLVDSKHLDARYLDELPTFDLLPNRGLDPGAGLTTQFTLEWTFAVARAGGLTDMIDGLAATCVETGPSPR